VLSKSDLHLDYPGGRQSVDLKIPAVILNEGSLQLFRVTMLQ
jgi:hypothetical protein